ncbi:MAG TPA: Asp-tRNA(Asn)/Glu-tRNA(Gln) amidotransferase subunit GatB [Bdellovibrionota bacterium]|nr:Asp-tRNA(Asn)/Glu-tRNA(Gln) amidotransferase subunit GatB [Bdellovibrionota bacterium]
MSQYEAVIGLEVHCQLSTESKIFCGCRARLEGGRSVADVAANANTCPICTGQPGSLPVLNKKVVEYAIKAGLATHCRISQSNVLARKNYFYPDLPKGYQISQYEQPICEEGWLDIETSRGPKRVRIQRIHMEEDAGKNVHMSGYSLVNLNRAGVPLIEIVTAPDLSSPEEAGAYLRALYAVVTYLGICDGNLQEGNFRCDANVSVRPKGEKKLGTRAEIKNVNSFRFIEKAIEFEILRQTELVKSGGRVVQETRGYDSAKNQTYSQRSKEEAQDYRYFPDPDLVTLKIDDGWISRLKGTLPELPEQKRARYQKDLGLTPLDAATLTASQPIALFFEKVVSLLGSSAGAKTAANLMTSEVTRLLNEADVGLEHSRLKPEHVAATVGFVMKQEISSTGAKALIVEAWQTGDDAGAIVERKGLRQVSDTSALEPAVEQVLAANAAQAAELKAGKEKLMGFFVGQVMKQTGGKANPALVQEIIKKKLGV